MATSTWSGQIAHRHEAKVNDVLLAVTAAGRRGLRTGRGEAVEDITMPVYVPITLRPEQDREQARGNLIGQMVVPLPIGEPDANRRLEQITAKSAKQKASNYRDLGRWSAAGSRVGRRWRSWIVIQSASPPWTGQAPWACLRNAPRVYRKGRMTDHDRMQGSVTTTSAHCLLYWPG